MFGIDAEALGGVGDVPYEELPNALARRRVYLHPIRWTSLGLSLLEAMHVGMPVVALATTAATEAVPKAAALRRLVGDPGEARERGLAAREAVLERYGVERFLADWDEVIEEA